MLTLLFIPYILVFVGTLLFSYFFIKSLKNGTEGRRFPPSLPSLPIVGSLPFLRDFDNLAEFFLQKSQLLGPIFTIKMFSRRCLVLNTKEVIEEALLKQSTSYAGREMFFTEKYLFNKNRKGIIGRNFDVDYRRYHSMYLSVLKEFGFGGRNLIESRISAEVEAMAEFLKKKNDQPFDPKELTMRMVSNVICSILFDNRGDFDENLSETVILGIRAVERMDSALDVAPVLRFLPSRWKNLVEMQKIYYKYIDKLKEEINKSMEAEAPMSFVRRVVEKEGPDYDQEQLILALRDLFAAGTDTVLSSILWTYVLLANHPDIQKHLQNEIDEAIPKDRLPSLEDKPKLPFVEATILEVMRIHTVAPMAIPHLTLKDTEVCGFFIPVGTVVFPNLHAAHMDKKIWVDPENFRPDRFLDKHNNVVKDLIIPFSFGRRACLGEALARQELFLFITGLMQKFTVRPPEGQKSIMVENCGMIVRKPTQFEARFIARE